MSSFLHRPADCRRLSLFLKPAWFLLLLLSSWQFAAAGNQNPSIDDETTDRDPEAATEEEPALEKRVEKVQESRTRSFTIAPHRLNYLLPLSVTNNINEEAYASLGDFEEELKEHEVKFQISLAIPLSEPGLFTRDDGFFFTFTMRSWWQLYTSELSAPFRETNYRPEIFYYRPLRFLRLGNGEWSMLAGLEHESNGRSQLLSRSWNRAFVQLNWAKGNGVLSLRPWYRFEEDPKDNPDDAKGDDNPDIEDYMGHFSFSGIYQWPESNHEISFLSRLNTATDRGAIEVDWTFPLFGKVRGMVQVFNGYGDSLIDYNVNQTRFSIGLAMSELL